MQEKKLELFAAELRLLTLEEFAALGFGHVGGALSVVELLAVLYGKHLRCDPANPHWPERDWLVMSKGHAGPAVYAALCMTGFFSRDMLMTLNKGGTYLPSHCDRNKTPGVDMTTGSLGQGISTAIGVALGNRLKGYDNHTYFVVGDGECNEGQIWEGAQFAPANKLNRLIGFCDVNGQQLDGYTKNVLDTYDLAEKWRAFRWNVLEVDGHDVAAIDAAITSAKAQTELPTMIVLHTVKGKGCILAEGKEANHHIAFKPEEMAVCVEEHRALVAAMRAETGLSYGDAQGTATVGVQETARPVSDKPASFKVKSAFEKNPVMMRQTYAETLSALAESDDAICALDADLVGSSGMKSFQTAHPEKFFNVGIAEANMVGIAAGLSAVGFVPYAHSFGIFASRRVCDQIFMSCAYAKLNVRIMGSDPGVTAAYNGGTHMPFEDMGVLRSIPGVTLVEPCDNVAVEDIVRQLAREYGVYYIRMARKNAVSIYEEGSTFQIGKGNVLRAGTDVTIIASGIMVAQALLAAEQLAAEGISARVVDMFTWKPMDHELVATCAAETGAIVTAENHNTVGGLGAAVAESMAQSTPCPMELVGIDDRFGQVGTEDYLRAAYDLTAEHIAAAAKKAISRKK